jgi:hypothetical protein
MRQLVIALYVEGPTDERFLPPLVRRTAEDLLAGRGIDILDPVIIDDEIHALSTLEEQIVRAAQKAKGFYLLIVHQDADAPTRDQALDERIDPSLRNIVQHPEDCQQHIVPLIPVRMIESWMLVDSEAFCAVLPGCHAPENLGFPNSPNQVESIPEPKTFLHHSIERGLAHRPRRQRQRFSFSRVQSRLGESIRLSTLQRVPSYQIFREEFSDVLRELHFFD